MGFQNRPNARLASNSLAEKNLVNRVFPRYAILSCLSFTILGLPCPHALSVLAEVQDDASSPGDQDWFRDVPWSADDSSTFASQLFEPIEGRSFDVRPIRRDDVNQWEFKGTCRLANPFPDGQSLWIRLVKAERLSILVRNGPSAVLLRLYPSFHHAWAAYSVEFGAAAAPSNAIPLELLATDNGRYRRSGGGSFALHWSAGQVILSRGNLRLLTAPFAVQPSEVILDGDFRLQDCRWHAFSAIPEDDEPGTSDEIDPFVGHPAAVSPVDESTTLISDIPHVNGDAPRKLAPPGRMRWERGGGEASVSLEDMPGGGVRLAAPAGRDAAYFAFTLPDGALYEAELDIGRATPGTGIFLGDQEGKPFCGLQFDRAANAGTVWIGFSDARRGSERKNRDPQREIVPVTQGKVRLRLLWGAGTLRWMISPDGVHWSFCGPFAERMDRKPRTLGVFLTSAGQDRVLELQGIRVIVDRGWAGWPSPDRLPLVPRGIAQAENMERWWQEVRLARPLAVTPLEWIAACAWKTLSENPNIWLAPELLEAYWLALLDSDLPFVEKLRISRILAGYMNPRDWGVWTRFYEQMEHAAIQAARRGEQNVFSQYAAIMMTAPLWSEWQRSAFSDALFRHELFACIYHDEERAAVDLSLLPLFWAVPGDDFVSRHLRRLAIGTAARYPQFSPPALVGHTDFGVPTSAVADDDKDAHLFWRELETVLREQAWREAAQRIWTVSASKNPSALFPHPDRGDLFLSLSCLVRVLEERHPELKEALAGGYGEQSQVLLRESQRRGDERLAVSLTEGLPGLAAAGQAAEWLGDRRAVMGRFAEARSWYEIAVAYAANESERQRIAEKQTRVLGGLDEEDPIRLGMANLGEAAGVHGDSDVGAAPEGSPGRITPLFEIPGDRMVRSDSLPERDFDWPVRQLGVAAADDWLIIHNQRDVACYRSRDGNLLWEQRLGGDQGNRSVPLAKMQPVVRGETVFCRRSTSRGPEVAALGILDGQVIWNVLPLDAAVSDPWFVGRELFVLAAERRGAGHVGLVLVALDPERGTVLKRDALFELRRVWSEDLNLLIRATGGTFFAQGEGVIFRADYAGRVRWLREQPWIAPKDRSWWQAAPWFLPIATAPIVSDGRVYAHQPGSWTVEALSTETGEPIWSRSDGRLIRTLAAWDGRLWLQSEDGLLTIKEDDGQVERFYPLPNVLAVGFLPQTAQVWCVTSREVPGKPDGREWRFHWLDARLGRIVHEVSVPAEGKDWQFFGPVIAVSDGILFWTASRLQPAGRRCYRMESRPNAPLPTSPGAWESPHLVPE